MKTNAIKIVAAILVMYFVTGGVRAQGSSHDIPATVADAFKSQYPKAHLRKWDKTKTEFQATFKMDGKKYSAYYAPDGTWLRTALRIPWSWKLPSPVLSGFKQTKYKDWDIDALDEVNTPTDHYYTIEVDNDNLQIDLFHAGLFTEYWLLTFKNDGQLSSSVNVTPQFAKGG